MIDFRIYECNRNGTVLVLNELTLNGDSQGLKLILIDATGSQAELSCFEHESDTQAFHSCSVNWQNQMIVFGGYHEREQISRLEDYRLNRIGSLAFGFYNGACTVISRAISRILAQGSQILLFISK